MARPPTWLPRLHQLRQAVSNSVRSHYDRKDLERLFELQPRGAGKLLELLPTVPVGTAHLVDREVLLGFLERVHNAEDVHALFELLRQEKGAASRRKIRSLVRRDLEPVGLSSLPESIGLSRGRLEVSFRTVDELAEAMLILARILENEGDAFADLYEPEKPQTVDNDVEELRQMFRRLEEAEAERSTERTSSLDYPGTRAGQLTDEATHRLSE